MINSKAELKRKLNENKNNLKFKTIVNHCKEGFMVGITRNAGDIIQGNAFTIETYKEDGKRVNSWTYYKDINVKNNMIIYKDVDIQIEIIEMKEIGGIMEAKCQYCGRKLSDKKKRKRAKYCDKNCKAKAFYHKKNPSAVTYNTNKTEEQKRQEHNKYCREYYKNNAEYREKHKQRRRERYKLTGK